MVCNFKDVNRKGNSFRIPFLNKIIAVVVALVIWQIAAMCIHQKILLVTPIEVFARLFTIWQVPHFGSSVWFTFYHIAGGFLLGVVLGIVCAVLANRFPVVETLLWPWMATIKSVPVASFVVICLIWLSAQHLSVFISFLIVLPIIYQNVLSGLRAVNPQMEELAKVYGMSPMKKLRYITIPQLAPFLMSGFTVTTGMAWKAGVAAEIIGTPNGSVGQQLYLAKIYLDTDDLLAWTVIIVVISVLSEKLFLFFLKKVLRA